MTETQVQRCMAYLELARTAIDNAELRIVGAPDSERPPSALIKALGEIVAGVENLKLCTQEISQWAHDEVEKQASASTVDGVAARESVSAKQKG